MRKVILALLVATCMEGAMAINYEFGEFNADLKTCAIIGWNGDAPSGSLILPEEYTYVATTYKVTSIAANALDNLTEVTEIMISKNINKIGDATSTMAENAANFHNCPKLERYSVASGNVSFTTMGVGVLVSSGSRHVVRVPQALATDNGIMKMAVSVADICEGAFDENSTIKELYLSPNITAFDSNGGLNNMKELEFIGVNGTTTPKYYCIEYGVLYDINKTKIISYPPKKKGESFTAPTTVTTLGDDCFANTGYLYQVSCSNVATYGKRAFAGSGITQMSISSKVSRVGEGLFRGCPRLGSIQMHRDFDIPARFAADCPQLETVTGTSMAVTIYDEAFANCPKLKTFPFTAHSLYYGNDIFNGCGFENVTFASSTYNGDKGFMDENFLANNHNLSVIDLSAVTIPSTDDAFDWGFGMVFGCEQIKSVKFPSLTKFWYDPNNLRPVFEPNCPIEHIEIGAFYPGHAPIFTFTEGEYYPNIFVKTTDALTQCCPLNKLIKSEGRSVVRPNVYCEAYSMVNEYPYQDADEYVIENSDYYVPGNTLENYSAVTGKLCRLYETYLFIGINNNGKYDAMVMPLENGLTIESVVVNGIDVGKPDASSQIHTDIPYELAENARINYDIRGVKMTTYYPTLKTNTSSVENLSVGVDSKSDDTLYDLTGRRVAPGTRGIVVSPTGNKTIVR